LILPNFLDGFFRSVAQRQLTTTEKNKRTLSLQDLQVATYLQENPIKDLVTENLAKYIHLLLKKLDPDDRQFITAIDLEGVSQTELANQEGLQYSSLKSKVQRARRKLKNEIRRSSISP
jgi:RNA polymerase sigma-70 factor, ECF subfamily